MILTEKLIAEYNDGKLTLIKNKGTNKEIKISLNTEIFKKLCDFFLIEKYKEFCKNSGVSPDVEILTREANRNAKEPSLLR